MFIDDTSERSRGLRLVVLVMRRVRNEVQTILRTAHKAPYPCRRGSQRGDTVRSVAALQAPAQTHAGGDWFLDHGDLGKWSAGRRRGVHDRGAGSGDEVL